MFLRFVRLMVREGAEARLAQVYRERIIPALRATDGCRFAGLLAPWRGGDAHRSLTLWETPQQALAYEESGRYQSLLQEVEPLLSGRTEWRVRLTQSADTTAGPARLEIPAEGYDFAGEAPAADGAAGGGSLFVRILSVRVDPERLPEFVALYTEHVIPAVRRQPGSRGVLLAEGEGWSDRVLSISFWDREEDAVRYESSGEPERLTGKLKATFSPIYDWKLTLVEGRDPRAEAPKVATYHLVQGQRLDPGGEGG